MIWTKIIFDQLSKFIIVCNIIRRIAEISTMSYLCRCVTTIITCFVKTRWRLPGRVTCYSVEIIAPSRCRVFVLLPFVDWTQRGGTRGRFGWRGLGEDCRLNFCQVCVVWEFALGFRFLAKHQQQSQAISYTVKDEIKKWHPFALPNACF